MRGSASLQGEIGDGRLAAGIDDGLGAHVADEGIDDHQRAAKRVERHVDETRA